MLKKRKVERRYLEPAQIDALLAAAAHHPPDDTIIRLFLYSGLRRGELFSLKWDDLDWGQGEGGQIAVRRSSYRGQVTEPKTEAGARRVDVPQFVLDDLQTYRMMYPPQVGNNLIFRRDSGGALNPDDWYRERFLPIVEEAGVGHIGIHGLRHTYCSLLVNQNENIKYISRQLGHASIQITSDLYSHLFKETSTSAPCNASSSTRSAVSLSARGNRGAC
jgi:integrase